MTTTKSCLVNVDHITDAVASVFNGKRQQDQSTNIDGENYIEVNETLEQIRILVMGMLRNRLIQKSAAGEPVELRNEGSKILLVIEYQTTTHTKIE